MLQIVVGGANRCDGSARATEAAALGSGASRAIGASRPFPLVRVRDLTLNVERPPKTLPRVAGHHADWLPACKGGTPACSNFEYGARLTEFILQARWHFGPAKW
jgi:hypothetical protein